jgi:hypothetical protein
MVNQVNGFSMENFNWSTYCVVCDCSCCLTSLSDRLITMPAALPSRLNRTPPPEDIPYSLPPEDIPCAVTPDLEGPNRSTIYPRSSSQEPGGL